MKSELTKTIIIQISDCDISGRWRPSAAQATLLGIGEENAMSLGLSYTEMLQRDMCWVLYRQQINLHQIPKALDEVKITTWPGAVEGPLFARCFILETEEGTRIGEAITSWVLINVKTRRPLRPSVLQGQLPENTDRVSPMPLPGVLRIENAQYVEERTVLYSDVDVNGHMNNARYLDWVCDILPLQTLRARGINQWQVNYIAEALPGEKLELSIREEADLCYIVGKKSVDGRTAFEAKIWYDHQSPER